MHLLLLVVNKNGSLVYTKVLGHQQFAANELIRLASTFHSMHAISAQITPTCQINRETQLGSPVYEGISEIEADTFVMKCLQTLTGVKFLLSSEPNSIKE